MKLKSANKTFNSKSASASDGATVGATSVASVRNSVGPKKIIFTGFMKGLVFVISAMAVLFLYDVKLLANPEGVATEHSKNENHHGEGHHSFANVFPQPKPNLALHEPPGVPQLIEPAFATTVIGTKVTLKWKEGANSPDAYHVQVATDPNFKWLVQDEQQFKGNSFDVAELKANTSYFWRVASVKTTNHSQFTKSPFKASSFETK